MSNIQFKEAKAIRERWEAKKKKDPSLDCKHTKPLKKEYYLGSATGDYICPDCGETVETK